MGYSEECSRVISFQLEASCCLPSSPSQPFGQQCPNSSRTPRMVSNMNLSEILCLGCFRALWLEAQGLDSQKIHKESSRSNLKYLRNTLMSVHGRGSESRRVGQTQKISHRRATVKGRHYYPQATGRSTGGRQGSW